ncbi:beta-lactamase [Dictyocaulus viviparus]|uniref:Beta-lactamase n=1 Tax=Dictyocaulus viviparus TaxID=29172 RepID=A0A0D8Y9T4_DICVI|nr:beta-lactamase [Dictyocaulus viviparus]
MKVDKGECNYEDKVIKFWPQFGNNGKEDITIEMILTHRAGLPYFDAEFDFNEMTNEKLSKIIEDEEPKYPPGTKTEYHAVTFGWLIDQVFRRIDKNQRTIGEFFRDEIQKKYNVDLYIGSCAEQENRIAKLRIRRKVPRRNHAHDRKILMLGQYFRCKGAPRAGKGLRVGTEHIDMFNDPRLRVIGQPAVNGVASARSLAQTFQLFMNGSLVSTNFLKRISQPQYENEFDRTIGSDESKGYGFIYDKSPLKTWQIGHRTIGGQTIRMDIANNLIICYLTNTLKKWVNNTDPKTYCNLQTAIYNIVKKKKEENQLKQ